MSGSVEVDVVKAVVVDAVEFDDAWVDVTFVGETVELDDVVFKESTPLMVNVGNVVSSFSDIWIVVISSFGGFEVAGDFGWIGKKWN